MIAGSILEEIKPRSDILGKTQNSAGRCGGAKTGERSGQQIHELPGSLQGALVDHLNQRLLLTRLDILHLLEHGDGNLVVHVFTDKGTFQQTVGLGRNTFYTHTPRIGKKGKKLNRKKPGNCWNFTLTGAPACSYNILRFPR